MAKECIEYENIVFDMGNTLIDYDAKNAIRVFTKDADILQEVYAAVFCSAEWTLLDAGLIAEDAAEARWLPRLSSGKARECARQAFRDWHLYNMRPKAGMGEVLAEVKARGQRIYILSNASLRLPRCYREVMPRAELYDGVFFSAEYGCIKPQDIIYQRFFAAFRLDPASCFFIDDLEDNIAAGYAQGMEGYVFSDGDVRKLREALGLPPARSSSGT